MITHKITKSQYMSVYKSLYTKVCRSEVVEGMIELVKRSVKNDSIVSSKYTSCQSIVADFYKTFDKSNSEANKYDKLVYTSLQRLGILLKKDGKLYLNPLIQEKSTKRSYELVIKFYNLMLEGQDIDLYTLEQLKVLAIDKSYFTWVEKQNDDIHYANYLAEKTGIGSEQPLIEPLDQDVVYEIAFNTPSPKKNLTSNQYRIHKTVQEAYRNLCNDKVKALTAYHIQLLEEQGALSIDYSGQTPIYTFKKMTSTFFKSLPSYKTTNLYLNNVAPETLTVAQNYITSEVVNHLEIIDDCNEEVAQHHLDFKEETYPPSINEQQLIQDQQFNQQATELKASQILLEKKQQLFIDCNYDRDLYRDRLKELQTI